MNYFKISLGIILILSASRLIPHPPNFTSLQALSFYLPAIFGLIYLPAILIGFIFTDFIIGFHNTLFFTWGSIVVIAIFSKMYNFKNFKLRIFGSLFGALIFYIITNFGVWSFGSYGYTFQGLLECYILAIPFFGNALVSTFVYALVIEFILKAKNNFFIYKKN